jgi:cytochrome c oxidase subunit 3
MASTILTPPKPQAPSRPDFVGGHGHGWSGDGFGGGPPSGRAIPLHAYWVGMYMALAAILMIFAAFTSALVVRRGISNDWAPTVIPQILYLNTLILLASSATLEFSRRSLAAGRGESFSRWLNVTMLLGLAFIGGQLLAWRELVAQGVYLSTNPTSSFFYLLTAAHGIHLLGGIGGLAYLVVRARRIADAPKRRTVVDITALYWHFMDGLWIYLLFLIMVRL